jgi:hypothetical protein
MKQAKIKTNGIVICLIAILAILLCSVATTPVRAGSDNAGMLFPKGTITVNGVQTSAPIAVFPGDKIETGNSVAALSANGKVSFVAAKSSIVFNGQAVGSSNSNLGKVMAREEDDHHHNHHSPNKPCHGEGGDEDHNNQGGNGNGNCNEQD